MFSLFHLETYTVSTCTCPNKSNGYRQHMTIQKLSQNFYLRYPFLYVAADKPTQCHRHLGSSFHGFLKFQIYCLSKHTPQVIILKFQKFHCCSFDCQYMNLQNDPKCLCSECGLSGPLSCMVLVVRDCLLAETSENNFQAIYILIIYRPQRKYLQPRLVIRDKTINFK